MSELANPFDRTLATLKADWPAEFTLEVDSSAFRDVPGYEYARGLASAMENMKHQARAMGYEIAVREDMSRQMWVYRFTLKPGVDRPKPQIEDSLEVTTLPLGENSE